MFKSIWAVKSKKWKKAVKTYVKKLINYKPVVSFHEVELSYFLAEAEGLGIHVRVLGQGLLQFRKDAHVQNLQVGGGTWTDLDGGGTLRICGDKVLCHAMLKEAGLPVPEHVVLASDDVRSASAFQKHLNAPIVVKPAKNTADGTGVSLKLTTEKHIREAVYQAGQFGEEVIVEKFYEGTNYRLLFCNNQLLSAVARIPAVLKGDGKRTIRTILQSENEVRLDNGRYIPFESGSRPLRYKIPVTNEVQACLAKQGLTLHSIPAQGEVFQLQEICHWLKGGSYRDVTDTISSTLVDVCRKAVETLGVKLAGVDLIATDIENPQPGSYVLNEVNTTPNLLVHYEVENQKEMRPVAREILKAILKIDNDSVNRELH